LQQVAARALAPPRRLDPVLPLFVVSPSSGGGGEICPLPRLWGFLSRDGVVGEDGGAIGAGGPPGPLRGAQRAPGLLRPGDQVRLPQARTQVGAPFSPMLLFVLQCCVNLFRMREEKQDATPLVVQNALSRFVCTLQQGRSRSLCMQILLSDAIYVKFAYASLYTWFLVSVNGRLKTEWVNELPPIW